MSLAAPVLDRRRDRLFYVGMAAVIALVVFVGFSRTYYLKAWYATPPLSPLLHAHGFLFTSWIVLLLSQVGLVAAGRTDLHRRLGWVGAGLAPMMVVAGLAATVDAGRRGSAPTGVPPLAFMAVPMFDMLVFSVLVGAGLCLRRRPETHKRLLLLASVGILAAAVARLPFAFIMQAGPLAFFGLTDLLVLSAVLYDLVTYRRVHPAYAWGGAFIVVSQPLRLAVSGTGAWLSFAAWLVGK